MKTSPTVAREKARKAMLELQQQRAERDARIQAQVEQFYMVSDVVEEAQAKLKAAQAAHEQARADARIQQALVVRTLAAEKVGETEIANLCGITLTQVRSLRRAPIPRTSTVTDIASTDSTAPDAHTALGAATGTVGSDVSVGD